MKHIVWIRYILMALSVLAILFGWVLAKDEGAGVDMLLRWLYVVLGLGVGAMILMSIFSLAQNPKAAGRSLLGLVLVLVVIGAAWALSSTEQVVTPTATYTNPTELKVTDTSLFAMYACLAVAVVSIVLLEIRNAFK